MRKKDRVMKVWLSAGHQADTGANGFISEGKEAIFLRDSIVSRLKEKAPEITIKIDDDKDGLQTTINKMREFKPDVMVDIHFNAATPSAKGCEAFISNEISREIATEMVEAVASILLTKKRGVKAENESQHSKLGMLHPEENIKVLLEVCFVTNKADSDAYILHREALADRLADILIKK